MSLTLRAIYSLLALATMLHAASVNGVSSLPSLLRENSPQFGPCVTACQPYWTQTLACFRLPAADAGSCVCAQDYINDMATCFTCLVPLRAQEDSASAPGFKSDAQFGVNNAIAACREANHPVNTTSFHF